MVDVIPSGTALQQAAAPPPGASAAARPPAEHSFFHELLSDLNPLQYIPVVGTIYRAITGDQGNPTMRFVASLGTSFALGGPIGVAITAGERLAGINPERAVLDAARSLFHLGHAEPHAQPHANPAAAPDTPSVQPLPAAPTALAFAVGTQSLTADDLNGLELQRLQA